MEQLSYQPVHNGGGTHLLAPHQMKCLRGVVLLFYTFVVHTATSSSLLSFIGIAHPSSRNIEKTNGGLSRYGRHYHQHNHRVRRCRAVVELHFATKKSSTTTDPNYWYNENDPFIIVDNNQIHTSGMLNNANSKNIEEASKPTTTLREQLLQHNIDPTTANPKCIKFTIRGNPRVLIRHRTARGFVYNPSKASQDNFRNVLLDILPRGYHPTILDDDDDDHESDDEDYCNKKDTNNTNVMPTVLFTQDEYLSLSLTFRMKRPKSHFINNKPGPNRLKKQFTSTTTSQYSNIRSDIDNLCKFVMDTLNGIVYVDDRQVVQLMATKVLDCEDECLGATEVEIRVL